MNDVGQADARCQNVAIEECARCRRRKLGFGGIEERKNDWQRGGAIDISWCGDSKSIDGDLLVRLQRFAERLRFEREGESLQAAARSSVELTCQRIRAR